MATICDNEIREMISTQPEGSRIVETPTLEVANTSLAQDAPKRMSLTFGRAYKIETSSTKVLIKKLSLTDKLLTPAILLAMIVGVIIGEFVPNVQPAFDTARFASVSVRTYRPDSFARCTLTSLQPLQSASL